jgi:DNA-binding transcriptional MerR regulator
MNRELKIGEKSFFKIGEVSAITKLPASVLRFWESEFSFLKPRKSQGRHRVYDRQTIETVLEIKRMLYEEGYTIMGLKRYWRRRRSQSQLAGLPSEKVAQVRNELQDILGILNSYSTKSGQISVHQ